MIKLSEAQQVLYNVLQQNGGWMKQPEIAAGLGKSSLSPDDMMQLDLLEDAGLLVKEIADNKAPDGGHVSYRAAVPKAEVHS